MHHKIDAEHLIDSVQKLANERGERMTDVRRDTLIALSKLGKPQSAHHILMEINKKRASKLSAMSLYRTLHFLIDLGVVIKMESRNTYQLCADKAHNHGHLMMVCDICGETKEVEDSTTTQKLHDLTRKHGHILKHHAIELHGACSGCL